MKKVIKKSKRTKKTKLGFLSFLDIDPCINVYNPTNNSADSFEVWTSEIDEII